MREAESHRADVEEGTPLPPSEASTPATPDALPAARPEPASRWTQRMAWYTGVYALIGALIGLIMAGLVTYLLIRVYSVPDSNIVLEVIILIPLQLLGVYRASYGTCAISPVAPRGVAIGLGAGSLLAVLALAGSLSPLLIPPVAGAVAFSFGYAGFRGGTKGVLHRFGLPVVGVGNLCAHCAYDLSGTPEHAVCSECGGLYRYTRAPK